MKVFFWTLFWLANLANAETVAQPHTPSEAIAAMRNLASAAETGKISPGTHRSGELAGHVLQTSANCNPRSIAPIAEPPMNFSDSAPLPGVPQIDCRAIRRGLAAAKVHWSELLCVVKKVVWNASQLQPNLRRIGELTQRATKLRQAIDIAFPPGWDLKSQLFVREWRSSVAKLKDFAIVHLDWGGFRWPPQNLPPGFKVVAEDDGFSVEQALSVTSYCLEPQRLGVKFAFSGEGERRYEMEVGVR